MPIYFYLCPNCGLTIIRVLKQEEPTTPCDCGTDAKRTPKAPTTRITETLDNGVMVKKVERLADAEQIHDEWAHGKKGTI